MATSIWTTSISGIKQCVSMIVSSSMTASGTLMFTRRRFLTVPLPLQAAQGFPLEPVPEQSGHARVIVKNCPDRSDCWVIRPLPPQVVQGPELPVIPLPAQAAQAASPSMETWILPPRAAVRKSSSSRVSMS